MKKTILLIIAISCLANIAFAQSEKAYTKKAEEALAAKNYSAAFAQYHFLVDKAGRSNIENYYGAAESARQAKVYYLAESYYKRVAELENGTSIHPITEYWIADVQKRQGNYLEAKNRFQSFLDNGGSANATYAEKARKGINDCDFAMNLVPTFEEDKIEHLDTTVNSVVLDFAPVESGGMLYFSSMREGYEYNRKLEEEGSPWVKQVDDWDSKDVSKAGLTHIYVKNEESGEVKFFDQFNEGDKHTAHIAFANNNTRIYYTLCENVNAADINCKLYYRDQVADNNWGDKIAASINMEGYTTTQPSIGKDGDKDILFFASNRPGSKGGLDIWYSYLEDGTCSDPVNLSDGFGGNDLNTTEDEMSPFWDAKSQTLYFSSEGHTNMGSHDIYKVKLRDGKCGKMEHLGAPINSSYDDTYYSLSDDNKAAYFTSNRPGGLCGAASDDSLCVCNDIYKVAMPKVKLEVFTFNAISKKPLWSTNVNLANETNNLKDDQIADDNHFYEWYDSPLGYDFNFGVLGTKPQYDSDKGNFSTMFEERIDTVIRVDLYLMPKMDLTTYVYDKSTGERLPGATVELYYVGDQPSLVNQHPGKDKSEYFDNLTHDKVYMVTGSKEGYSSDRTFVTLEDKDISTMGLSEPTSLKAELRLCKIDLLPNVSVYFDNDIPHGTLEDHPYLDGTKSDTISDQSYEMTYNSYLGQRRSFENKFAAGSSSRIEMSNFFSNDVIGGFTNLERFAEQLFDFFESEPDLNAPITLKIVGYASLRSNPDYNLHLSKRRVSSIMQYFQKWTSADGSKSLAKYFSRLKVDFGFKGDTEPCMGRGPCYPKSAIEDVNASRDRRVDIIGASINTCAPTSTAPGTNNY